MSNKLDAVKESIDKKAEEIERKAKAAANKVLEDLESGRPSRTRKWLAVAAVVFVILFIIVFSIIVALAQDCRDWNRTVVGQVFAADVNGAQIAASFGDPVFGPCPVGPVNVTWGDQEETTFIYEGAPGGFLFIEGLRFALVGEALVYVPEGPLIILNPVKDEAPPQE